MTNWASERGFATARFDFRSSVGFGDGGVDDVVAVSRALLDRAGPQTKLILVRGWINTGGGYGTIFVLSYAFSREYISTWDELTTPEIQTSGKLARDSAAAKINLDGLTRGRRSGLV